MDAQAQATAMSLLDSLFEADVAFAEKALAKQDKTRRTSVPTSQRGDNKKTLVTTLLKRPDGATVAQIAEATGWQKHTIRGFISLEKKKGIQITATTDNKQTCYRIAA